MENCELSAAVSGRIDFFKNILLSSNFNHSKWEMLACKKTCFPFWNRVIFYFPDEEKVGLFHNSHHCPESQKGNSWQFVSSKFLNKKVEVFCFLEHHLVFFFRQVFFVQLFHELIAEKARPFEKKMFGGTSFGFSKKHSYQVEETVRWCFHPSVFFGIIFIDGS